jgi:hypothetical protein
MRKEKVWGTRDKQMPQCGARSSMGRALDL